MSYKDLGNYKNVLVESNKIPINPDRISYPTHVTNLCDP